MAASAPATIDAFDLDELHRRLVGTPFAGRIRHFPTIDSTNTLAMREAEQGRESNTVYLADEQTAGRGRGAHNWHSASGSGLYVSILLRPRIAPADILWLSLAAGLAVQAAVCDVTSLEPDIRWPNDLLLSGRKVGGILTELNAEVTRVRHAVIGIGLNVHQPLFPPELAALATSLRIETGKDWSRQELLIALLFRLHEEIERLTSPDHQASAAATISGRLAATSSWIRGKHVTVAEADTFSGVTDGLDSRGFLRVRTSQGIRTVLSGGIREGAR